MTTENLVTLTLIAVGDVALLLLGGWRRSLLPALLHAAGRGGRAEELRCSAVLWSAAARNAWVLTALAALVLLGRAFGTGPSSLGGLAVSLLGIAFVSVAGVALAGVLVLPALRLRTRSGPVADSPAKEQAASSPPASDRLAAWAGGLPLLAVLAWALALSDLGTRPAIWLLHWPAVLVVAGATVAIALYLGDPSSGTTLTASLTGAGTLGTLAGLAQALHGFASASIGTVTSGIVLALGACFTALTGLTMIGLPSLDRAAIQGVAPEQHALARAAAWVLPALAMLTVVLTAVMVMTPITRRMG